MEALISFSNDQKIFMQVFWRPALLVVLLSAIGKPP